MEKQGVVYECTLSNGKRYIGETGRCLGERVKEHKRDIRLGKTEDNPLAEHVWKDNVELGECSVVAHENSWNKRRTLEALWIGRRGDLNRDCGVVGVAKFWSARRDS